MNPLFQKLVDLLEMISPGAFQQNQLVFEFFPCIGPDEIFGRAEKVFLPDSEYLTVLTNIVSDPDKLFDPALLHQFCYMFV
ncbi:hypothetical protein SDC9_91063 [bioreactor metagenome]|uniref:Uncharacterized protein n=1 Tax=bioreactor metagenome TaxID=1076179 RepID=A0A644ZU32_9ZZZZ